MTNDELPAWAWKRAEELTERENWLRALARHVAEHEQPPAAVDQDALLVEAERLAEEWMLTCDHSTVHVISWALKRGMELERDRALPHDGEGKPPASTNDDPVAPAEDDQDTVDARAVLAGWEGRSLDADWLTEGAGFLAAKQALSEIKDRVRREEREAGKTYRHEVVWGEPWTSTQRDNCAELYGDGS